MTLFDTLQDLTARSLAEQRAAEELARAISRAHEAGWSLRDIAAVVGQSHETVRKVIASLAA